MIFKWKWAKRALSYMNKAILDFVEAAPTPIFLLGATGIPTVVLVNSLATNMALLGAAKLGIAAAGAPALIGEEEEEVGYGDSSIHKRQRQRQQRNH